MNAERARTFLLGLPHVVESEQWGGLVFWVGDKAVGGKMFAMLHLDGHGHPIFYPAGQERYAELLEREGIVPAPYMARIWWVAAERWDVFREREWDEELRAGHALVYEKLPPKVKTVLALPKAEFKRALDAGRKRRAEWELAQEVKKAGKRKTKSPMNLD
jgi:predicted DNA-binding protein (MmcQ/YjbR family)